MRAAYIFDDLLMGSPRMRSVKYLNRVNLGMCSRERENPEKYLRFKLQRISFCNFNKIKSNLIRPVNDSIPLKIRSKGSLL